LNNYSERLAAFLLKLAYRSMRVYWFFARPVTLGVRVLMIRDGHVLLVRHTYQDAWYLPGGGVKRGETLEQAVRREAWEEAGARLAEISLWGAYSQYFDYKSDHVMCFICTDFQLGGESDFEIERCGLFPLDRLPAGTNPGSRRRIEEYRRGRRREFGPW